jgi:uncharacterized protein YicC (UPF0701 family)
VSEPGNGYAFRIASLERRVERVEQLEPAVVKQQVADLKEDIAELASAVDSIRRILIGFLATFALTGIAIVTTVFGATH